MAQEEGIRSLGQGGWWTQVFWIAAQKPMGALTAGVGEGKWRQCGEHPHRVPSTCSLSPAQQQLNRWPGSYCGAFPDPAAGALHLRLHR